MEFVRGLIKERHGHLINQVTLLGRMDVVEALVKLIKRALSMSIGDSVPTFSELQTVLFEVANMLNERPIGAKPGTNWSRVVI